MGAVKEWWNNLKTKNSTLGILSHELTSTKTWYHHSNMIQISMLLSLYKLYYKEIILLTNTFVFCMILWNHFMYLRISQLSKIRTKIKNLLWNNKGRTLIINMFVLKTVIRLRDTYYSMISCKHNQYQLSEINKCVNRMRMVLGSCTRLSTTTTGRRWWWSRWC